jgi:hypothetical protein
MFMLDTIANQTSLHIERDSRKDEAVVFIFIFATGGLLTWALLKPWIERYIEVRPTRISRKERTQKQISAIGLICINFFSCFWFLARDWKLVANVIVSITGCSRTPIIYARWGTRTLDSGWIKLPQKMKYDTFLLPTSAFLFEFAVLVQR